MRRPALAAFLLLLAPSGLLAAPPKPAKKAAAAPAAVDPAKLTVSLGGLVDRRVNTDFPPPGLDLGLTIGGEDAPSVVSAFARVTKAHDDTGRSLVREGETNEIWLEARNGEPPSPHLQLKSPERKAKTLTTVEGTLSAYLPSRDPNALVKVDRIAAQRDKPALASPALAKEKIRITVLSKEGLEKERAKAEAKKKADAAKKKKGKKSDGFEEMGEAMADAIGGMFERLFFTAGDHDLILKVDDPGKKVFSFGLVAPDGTPIQTYGTTDVEQYRIVRMFEPIPEGAALQVRLKTAKSFAEVPFRMADVKLP